jgi:hypothetical protein
MIRIAINVVAYDAIAAALPSAASASSATDRDRRMFDVN